MAVSINSVKDKKKIPYIVVGVEVGPISSLINRLLLKKIFNGAKVISVRNEESKLFLEKIKVKNKIEVNPDWIIGIDENDLIKDDINVSDLFNNYKNKKNIFVHLTSDINSLGVMNVINDLKKYQSINKNIRYIFGCDQNSIYQNEKVKCIFDMFNYNDNILLKYKGPWYLTKILKNIDAVITDKLHVGIVATKFKKEVICVAKDPKSIRFYNLIGRSEYANLLSNVKENETFNKLNKINYKDISINDKIILKSKNNQSIVDEFLN